MKIRLLTVALLSTFLSVFTSPVFPRELSMNNELFIEIEEMIVPIIQHRNVAGFFSIVLAVDCKNKETSQKIRKYLPIIRDRLFWDLYVLLGVIWSSEFRVNISDMKKRLRRRIESIVGKDQVNDVLVITFQQHERRNLDF